MRKYLKFILPGSIIILLILIIALRIVGNDDESDSRKTKATIVKIEPVIKEDIINSIQLNGDVAAIEQADIFSKVSGNIERVLVDIGSYVKTGQLLAVIDTTELYQTYEQMSATYTNAKIQFERTKLLFDKEGASKQDYDNAEAAQKVAAANYDLAKTRLGYARITAPFNGYITKKFLDPGAYISPGTGVLFTIMAIDVVKIIINLPENEIPILTGDLDSKNVKVKRVVATFDAYPGKEFIGSIARYSQAIDLSTRTMAVEIDLPNKEHILKPGMFATVKLVTDEHKNSLTISTTALLKDNKGTYVFTVENNKAKMIRVVAGSDQNNRTEILSGLNENEQIITTGQQFVQNNGNVIIQK